MNNRRNHLLRDASSVGRALVEDANVAVRRAAGAELDVGSLVAHAKLAYGAEHDLLELDRHPGGLLQLALDRGRGLVRLDVNLDGSSARKVVRDHLDRRRLAATEPQYEVKSALLLDVVVRERLDEDLHGRRLLLLLLRLLLSLLVAH